MQPIFADDSSLQDQRDVAIDRLLLLCPKPFRLMFRDKVVAAVDNTPPQELTRLMANIDNLQQIAATGDTTALIAAARDTARSFGVPDDQMAALETYAQSLSSVSS